MKRFYYLSILVIALFYFIAFTINTAYSFGLPPSHQIVYVYVKNTSGSIFNGFKNRIENHFKAYGYTITYNPNNAYVIIGIHFKSVKRRIDYSGMLIYHNGKVTLPPYTKKKYSIVLNWSLATRTNNNLKPINSGEEELKSILYTSYKGPKNLPFDTYTTFGNKFTGKNSRNYSYRHIKHHLERYIERHLVKAFIKTINQNSNLK